VTQIFGHRGAAGTFPENTMISFQEVERVGAEGIELDVQLTKDGEIVVIHDETLDRTTTGEGLVKDLTLQEIAELDASYKFPDYGVCKVPSLNEVFSWAKTNLLIMNVELKNSIIPYKGLEEKVINLIRQYHFEDRVIISSFNHNSLTKCHKLAPEIEIGVLYNTRRSKPWVYAKKMGATAIHPNHRVIANTSIYLTQQNSIAVRPYTVNRERDMKKLFDVKCSGIITDYPEKAIAIRNSLN
jgi:glycerophosphoryl diester phosphodiesterase